MRDRDVDQVQKQQMISEEKLKELILCKSVHEEENTLGTLLITIEEKVTVFEYKVLLSFMSILRIISCRVSLELLTKLLNSLKQLSRLYSKIF